MAIITLSDILDDLRAAEEGMHKPELFDFLCQI